MWKQILKDGKCRYFERYKDAMGESHVASVTYPKHNRQNEKWAKDALDKIIREKSAIVDDKLKLCRLAEMYLKALELESKPSTVRTATNQCKKLCELLGDVNVTAITAGYVKAKFLASELPPSTQNGYLVRFKTLFNWAFENDLVNDVQFLGKLKPMRIIEHRKSPEEKYLEADEVRGIRENLSALWQDTFDFMVLSGVRCGEMAALRVGDVNLEDRTISIDKTFNPQKNEEWSPKTDSSIRKIYIQDQLMPICEKMMKGKKKTDLLTGKRLYQESFGRALKKAAKGVTEKNVSPHTLRHTHCSLLAENYVPLEIISARLGHRNDAITREIYFHITDKMKDRENERLNTFNLF